MRLGITEYIDCAHHLEGHEKCGRVHGHTYQIDISLEGDPQGKMILDFGDFKRAVREVLAKYDHRDWNEFLPYPTVENICALVHRELAARLAFPLRVRVWEGHGKWAEA